MTESECHLANGAATALGDVPLLDCSALRSLILEKVAGGSRLASFFPFLDGERTELLAVLTNLDTDTISLARARVDTAFPSLTPECPQAHMFEREMAEAWGLEPRGHPWLKPVRFPEGDPSAMDFYRVEGEEVHEVAVGPVHAGVIEPGHFRFQCHGETVMHLEISLGYQHRGVEPRLIGGPNRLTRHLVETAAGDTTCGHGLAYAMIVDALTGTEVSDSHQRLRAIALELERIANHTGDLGALAGDVGFLPTASYCGRLRGDILNLTGLLCGNRFGRGLIIPGGTGYGMDDALASTILDRFNQALRDIKSAVSLMFGRPSVLARFEGTGVVGAGTAESLGMVGPAARASGLVMDVRRDQPAGMYRAVDLTPGFKVGMNGDVMDRARLRQLEIESSATLVRTWLTMGPVEATERPEGVDGLRPEGVSVALTEGWRGRICHTAITGPDGRFTAYKIVDPSFFNWSGLAMAMRGQQISDFPLCNKSFNLSYCGFDL